MRDEQIRAALDPRKFVAAHTSRGGVAPREVERMSRERREDLQQASGRQSLRRRKVQEAKVRLQQEIDELIGA